MWTIHSCCNSDEVLLRGGRPVKAELIERLLALEGRGVQFTTEGDSVRVWPVDRLTPDDRAWLLAHRDLVRDAVAYVDRIAIEAASNDRRFARSLPG